MAKRGKSVRKLSEVMQQISRKKRIRQLAFLAILIIVAAVFITGSRGTFQLYKFSKTKQDLKNEIETLETEKAKLENMKSKIETDPEYIEKIAREKYKMKKKEEKVYEIVEE
jgi:cell division protein FtsB